MQRWRKEDSFNLEGIKSVGFSRITAYSNVSGVRSIRSSRIMGTSKKISEIGVEPQAFPFGD